MPRTATPRKGKKEPTLDTKFTKNGKKIIRARTRLRPEFRE
jgi:hypothetical protein